jgi:hypothetical protein
MNIKDMSKADVSNLEMSAEGDSWSGQFADGNPDVVFGLAGDSNGQ